MKLIVISWKNSGRIWKVKLMSLIQTVGTGKLDIRIEL
jgi:hypothetical protein